jgi:hypothetical protein
MPHLLLLILGALVVYCLYDPIHRGVLLRGVLVLLAILLFLLGAIYLYAGITKSPGFWLIGAGLACLVIADIWDESAGKKSRRSWREE